MAGFKTIFKRIERKYVMSTDKYEALMADISEWLYPDDFPHGTVSSMYLDTPNFLLIRNSIDAKKYKEKLRVRGYNEINGDSKVFLEIKKKLMGIVYKRRVAVTLEQAMDYIYNRVKPVDSQIMNEIDYAMNLYGWPQPAAVVSYERDAYKIKNHKHLRLTFDTQVRCRFTDPTLDAGNHGEEVLPSDRVIMEFKTDGAMPLWLSAALDKHQIYPTSFSKYGTAYKKQICNVKDL